jgi:hypothetical protein
MVDVMAIRALMQNGIKIVKAPVICGRGAAYLSPPLRLPRRMGDGKRTNPEELLGAAHVGCFSKVLAL